MLPSMSSLFTTGLPSLDRVLKGVLPGDNIVWQVDAIEDYMEFVAPYAQSALASGRRLVYFRFADHAPLVPAGCGAEVHVLHPERGFEQFIKQIHQVIEGAGRGAFYVFDSLSELAADWYSDQMLGNFFVLTCPYLFDLETVAYFAIFRDRHSFHSIVPISETTQLFLEVYRHKGRLHVHPTKVLHRYSATMNMLHVWEGEEFRPVTSSSVISHIMSAVKWGGLQKERRPGFLERTFLDAQEQLAQIRAGNAPPDAERDLFARLARMVVSRDDGMLELLGKHMNVEDVFEIRRRMIGTGLIGGKTVGMLLARAILRDADPRFADLIEPHDSFFMGSDVFYTFLVRNGAWWMYQKQHDPATFLEGSDQARQRILTGTFPAYTIKQLEEMLDYFGQSPFIVRSSSLLEDNFGNSFAGKYDSVFCANQGPRERRLDDFLAAVRTIYASSMSERALRYRAQRGMLDRDEQMALLIMRVSGSRYGHYFYPPVAGVGFSFNPYVWSRDIDPHAGVVRLVFGLGTRAVNRSDDDYTRIVALNAPERRPEANFDEVRQYTQRRVDCIDLDANQLVSLDFDEVIRHCGDLPLDLLASEDRTAERDGRPPSRNQILTFEPLLQETEFVRDLRDIHRILQDAYAHPVDIEFTANFSDERSHQFNLVQCRPLQAKGGEAVCVDDLHIAQKDRIIAARSAVVGQGRIVGIDRFVYVVPAAYAALPLRRRHDVATLLGEINRALRTDPPETVMLLGPGRWGTSSPELGIPVAFADIQRAAVLCEIVAMREDLIPDVSLGTHFLNELVEMDMLYIALFPRQGDNFIDSAFFESAPNSLLELVPGAGEWASTVRVIDVPRATGGRRVKFAADALEQRFVCYYETD